MAEAATPPTEETPTPPPNPVYVHKLSDHDVQGDGTFREINDHDRPYEGGVEGAMKLPDLGEFLEAAEVKKKEEPDNTPLEPLPEIPKMPMTVDQAYDFLGVKKEDHGNLEKVKMRFRKMSLKWHPDKNLRRPKEASEIFTAVHAAYHFLTTNNFDYKRWAESFVIPPMQTLEDVLLMALKGADPYQIEMLLKKRGDYRPHQEFGINLSIPWSAGTKENPNYHVHTGSAYTTTQGLEDKQRRELGYNDVQVNDGAIVTTTAGMDTSDLLEKFGKNAQVGADEARPWETVGGVGFDQKKKAREPLYVPPKTRPDLTAASPEALTVAEEYNDRAVKAFKEKAWQRCYDEASEAIRLNPRKKEYLSNRAAAGLKLKGKRYQRQAAEDSVNAYELDPHYVKGYLRAAEAHLSLNERATVKLAVQELQQALKLDEDNAKIKEKLRDAQLTWEADFD
mmetsp:Transcript_43715/g.87507  ORF Transcript_43715/g.87507 Transcript_43715/m.87507 type:complete len:451 (-) Transcript_43715:424-1776(-)|eukprot:CAMPEP_0174719998 /NCGR_PEP_ID=MMETSP1094-20130205/32524_1 /TAXON_ID=156173 /ORGANISM="Chrysochromulina brevifilum, Strain UTEX LB 985" /LENGTH=450 /DNA_ID=CAMNT_0015920415 /DNA_START=12 /DNA_END=1364 /DNA_ORIENTATION=+